jgi:hypothetical protein
VTAPTTLRGDEYNVLDHFAEGHDAGVIANMLGLDLARVQGILTRKCQMNRSRARQLVNGGATVDTDHEARAALAASPLTAPITKTAKKPPALTPAKPTPPPPPALAEPAAVDWVEISSPNRLNGVPQPAPEPTVDLVSQMLDDGIQAIADRLRTLIGSLVDAALEQQARQRLADLERQVADARTQLNTLQAARAELATLDGGGS